MPGTTHVVAGGFSTPCHNHTMPCYILHIYTYLPTAPKGSSSLRETGERFAAIPAPARAPPREERDMCDARRIIPAPSKVAKPACMCAVLVRARVCVCVAQLVRTIYE